MAVPKVRAGWAPLVITSGLAAIITGLLGYAGVYLTQAKDRDARRCELAAQFLQDEAPSPYLAAKDRQALLAVSGRRFRDCMVER